MVISYILGGLGNQMFQYAAGRALALATRQPFRLDLSDFGTYKPHQGFEIERVFPAPVQVADRADVWDVLGWRSGRLTRRMLKQVRSLRLHGTCLAIEPHFQYWPGLMEHDGSCYLMGYWQSERYFQAFEPAIREDFCFRRPLEGQNRNIAECMREGQSVSLHVRRTDYLSHKKTAKVMAVQDEGYYRRASEYLSRTLDSPEYYIFSDDMDWVREHLGFLPNAVLIDHNHGADSYQDMQLMSCCRHHVIANSSFSWWGAWLNPAPDKIVIAPRTWFCNGFDDTDLVPSRWMRL